MSDYIIRGREIYSAKGKCVATLDDNGNPVMAPGMAGAHSRGVQEFLILTTKDTILRRPGGAMEDREGTKDFSPAPQGTQEDGMEDPPSPGGLWRASPATPDGASSVVPFGTMEDKMEDKQAAVASPVSAGVSATRPESDFSAEWEISTIPEDRLPPFSKALGVNTPGFPEYIARHKLTMPQVAALVKRLSR